VARRLDAENIRDLEQRYSRLRDLVPGYRGHATLKMPDARLDHF